MHQISALATKQKVLVGRPFNQLTFQELTPDDISDGTLLSFYNFLLPLSLASLKVEAMNFPGRFISIGCVVISFIANAGEPLTTKAKSATKQPTNAELQLLQGTWEGVLVGDKAQQKITITISDESLHFHRDTNFWFKTVITLPAGKDPKQLHATIKDCPPSQADSIGKVVKSFFKIEDEALTLATIGDDVEETQKSFEAAGTRYELRKVQPQKNDTNSRKTR